MARASEGVRCQVTFSLVEWGRDELPALLHRPNPPALLMSRFFDVLEVHFLPFP